MTGHLFTDVNKLREPSTGLIREDIPIGVRYRFKWALGIAAENDRAKQRLWGGIVSRLDLDPERYYGERYEKQDAAKLNAFVDQCSWNLFLDICTIVFEKIRDGYDSPELANAFRDTLNQALIRHYSSYRLRENGTVYEPGSVASNAAIEEARAILIDTNFDGPDRQFQKAVLALETRPEPDYEEAVSQAVNAVEAVAKICVGDDNKKMKFASTVNQIVKDKGLHKALGVSIRAISGYAAEAGGRHGVIGAPDADSHIAEYVVHECAAAIVLFARLYGYSVVESQPEPASVQ